MLKEVLPDLMNGPMVGMVKDLPMSFKQILKFANGQIPDEKVQELEQKLAELGLTGWKTEKKRCGGAAVSGCAAAFAVPGISAAV